MKYLKLVNPVEVGQFVYTARMMGGFKVEKFKEKVEILCVDEKYTLVRFVNDKPRIVTARRMQSDLFDKV